MAEIKRLNELDVTGKRVIVRVDWNVPISQQGEVVDLFRITTSLPTIIDLRSRGAAAIILLSHLGNPVVRPRESFERTRAGNLGLILAPVALAAARLLGIKTDPGLVDVLNSPLPGYQLAPDILLLENLRFHPGEQGTDEAFAQALANLGDMFVNEAFSESHRTVASLTLLPKLLPAGAGVRLLAEINHLARFFDKTEKPTVFALGGAKVHDKLLLIDNLLKKADVFLLGGVMANTFLSAQGVDMRRSVVETDRISAAKELFNRAPQKFILPLDFTWERERALDIGPQTVALFKRYFTKAKLIFWNGPMGWTDSGRDRFFHGTRAVARAITESAATSVAAGGDTLAVLDTEKLAQKFSFVSTGGGAALAYLAGSPMPGIDALRS